MDAERRGGGTVAGGGRGAPSGADATLVGAPGTAAGSCGSPSTVPPPSDRYVVVSRLGEGGVGIVYEARDTVLDRVVALKVLRAGISDEGDHRQRFADEARIMGGLEHPATVPVYDVGTLAGGEPFYTMKRVRGRTLRELLAARPPATVRDRSALAHLTGILERVCEAVAAAHATGLVHRDLKPENVMVDDFGAVYVMDWGLARRLVPEALRPAGHATQLGEVMGTPAYMPPEQARGDSHASGCEADVFSLGVILYEILTGTLPFAGATQGELVAAVLHATPDDPRRRNPRAPRALAAVCLKALEKHPLRRYPTAAELGDDVRRFREFLPVSAARQRASERAWGWARRRPLLAGSLAALALALATSLGAVALQVAGERRVMTLELGRLDGLRSDLERADAEIVDLESRLADSRAGGADRARLEQRLTELRERRDLDEQMFRATASTVVGFTRFTSDEAVQRLARERALATIERHLQAGEWTQAKVAIDWLVRASSGANPFGLSPADVAALRGRLAEVESRLAAGRAAP